jgi:hypothetical protein
MKKDIKQFWNHNIHPITGFNQPKQDVRMSIEGRKKHYYSYRFGVDALPPTNTKSLLNVKL